MKKRLTIQLDEELIKRVKQYAISNNKSLSAIVENYLLTLIQTKNKEEISVKLKSLIGIVKLPKNFDYKKERQKYLLKKYGL